jgi:antitoxin component YwqK of YwqJK toxin-antitoxin module
MNRLIQVLMSLWVNIFAEVRKSYYESGASLYYEGNCENGKLEGLYKGYSESDALRTEMNFMTWSNGLE